MSTLLSIIIPVYNGARSLGRCLDSVNQSTHSNFECMVIDDASTDASAALAAERGARILGTHSRKGPAHARNRGASAAGGDILLFIDADVSIAADTLARIDQMFTQHPALDALIGSYDDSPAEPDFLSQYKNLMHCFVHQHGRRQASTFWTGCGAIRRSVFLDSGGFDERRTRPSIEDIELGARLIRSGRTIQLDPSLTVKHLKRWTFFGLLLSDIRDRAIPWTILMLRERHIPNDLNVQRSQRLSIALLYFALLLSPFSWPISVLAIVAVIAINRRFYGFLAQRRGWWFALRAVPLHLLYFFYSGAAFACGCVLAGLKKQSAY